MKIFKALADFISPRTEGKEEMFLLETRNEANAMSFLRTGLMTD
jgi:hypothetical protein